MAHMIEVAKSGRAQCRTCRKNIPKDELRFGEEFANQFSTSGEPSYRWHHLACAAGKLPQELKGAMDDYSGNIPDRAALEKQISDASSKKAAKPGGFPFADKAPTGRARCMQCDETIDKGTFRVAIEREVDTGTFVTRGAGYMHPGCVSAQLDDAGGDMEEMIKGIQANSKLPKAELDDVIAKMQGGGGPGDEDDEDEDEDGDED